MPSHITYHNKININCVMNIWVISFNTTVLFDAQVNNAWICNSTPWCVFMGVIIQHTNNFICTVPSQMCDFVHHVRWRKIPSLWQLKSVSSDLPSVIMFAKPNVQNRDIPYYFEVVYGRLLSKRWGLISPTSSQLSICNLSNWNSIVKFPTEPEW